MSNSTLSNKANELELILKSKHKCYIKVGWLKESDGSVTYMVYVDDSYSLPQDAIPSNWYSSIVSIHRILPPGVAPVSEFDIAW